MAWTLSDGLIQALTLSDGQDLSVLDVCHWGHLSKEVCGLSRWNMC